MANRCDDCKQVLYPSDWQAIAIYNDERLRLCESCKGKRDSGPLVAARERMLEELRRLGFSPKAK